MTKMTNCLTNVHSLFLLKAGKPAFLWVFHQLECYLNCSPLSASIVVSREYWKGCSVLQHWLYKKGTTDTDLEAPVSDLFLDWFGIWNDSVWSKTNSIRATGCDTDFLHFCFDFFLQGVEGEGNKRYVRGSGKPVGHPGLHSQTSLVQRVQFSLAKHNFMKQWCKTSKCFSGMYWTAFKYVTWKSLKTETAVLFLMCWTSQLQNALVPLLGCC